MTPSTRGNCPRSPPPRTHVSEPRRVLFCSYGPVLNPHNASMHTGGSSGGTAAIVAARGAPAGFCSDTGGSCRNPASMTGIVGFRPTTGCYDAGSGILPLRFLPHAFILLLEPGT